MDTETTSVFLMVMVTCAAFVGAVNSRGTAKLVVSYLLAFICLAGSVFSITKYAVSASQQKASQLADEASQLIEEKLEKIEEMAEAEKMEEAEQEKQELINDYKRKAGEILSKAQHASRVMAGFKLEASSDEEYENLSRKASYFIGETRRLKAEVNKLRPPAGMESSHETLKKGVELLLFTSTKLKRFFNAENSEEELAMERLFRNKNRQAASLLNNLHYDF
jgi:hypothetical protein